MSIVSNSGPLITFACANHLELLKETVKELIIPEAVYHEIVTKGSEKPGAKEIEKAPWIKITPIKDKTVAFGLPEMLGEGEKEAIVVAEELKVFLLIDDPAARKEAQKRGLPLISTLNILLEAKNRGVIKSVKETLDRLIISGFRLKKKLYQKTIKKAGEI